MSPRVTTLLGLGLLASTAAQDPAEGWMAYAVGAMPSNVQRSASPVSLQMISHSLTLAH